MNQIHSQKIDDQKQKKNIDSHKYRLTINQREHH